MARQFFFFCFSMLRVELSGLIAERLESAFQFVEGVAAYKEASIEVEIALLDPTPGFGFRTRETIESNWIG